MCCRRQLRTPLGLFKVLIYPSALTPRADKLFYNILLEPVSVIINKLLIIC